MTLSVPNQGIDPMKTRNAVNAYCVVRKISTDRLALVLELNNEVYEAFMNGGFASDGRLTEVFMLLYWVLGINEADPVLYGIPSEQVSGWAAAKTEFIAAKRRELYRIEKIALLQSAQSDEKAAATMFWIMLLLTLVWALLGLTFQDNNPRTDGEALFFILAIVFAIFTPIIGAWWASAHAEVKKLQ